MSTNPFKSFIPYIVPVDSDPVSPYVELKDPSGGQWRTIGRVPPLKWDDSTFIGLAGAGTLAAVQFNERILPGKVRDELLGKKVAKLREAEGREPTKKEYAQLRDECEFELLGKAFIRRTVVPILFFRAPSLVMQFMLICTSSQKRADDIVGVLRGTYGEDWHPYKVKPKHALPGILTATAREGELSDLNDDAQFGPTDYALLKGKDKRTIAIKDKDISDADVLDLLKQDYTVHALGMAYGDSWDVEPELFFTLTDAMIFKGVTIPDVKPTMAKDDFHGFAVLCVQTYKQMLLALIEACGGLAPPPTPAVTDEDDEL